ncbi:MAG: VCBS repeat-containing protein [Phycisphaerae bacterium]|nr:VCBS repeat-containing protein [Phycisphaerae bacterium]
MKSLAWMAVAVALFAGLVPATPSPAQDRPKPVPRPGLRFEIRQLCVDANEGCAIADVNRDGKLDVIAGRSWYAGPDFASRPLRSIEDWNGYVQSNGDFAYDVDGDGWTDVIAGSFIPTQVHWYRNPGKEALAQGRMWEQHLLGDTGASQNEGQFLHDLDGDGVPEWVVDSWKKQAPLLAWKLTRETREVTVKQGRNQKKVKKQVPSLQKIVIGEKMNGHGMGFGDLNGDGREDIFVETGWYERPSGDAFAQPWKHHPDWNVHASNPVIIRDLDADGRSDIIVGKGHDFGLSWWQQLAPEPGGKLRWKQNRIDTGFSQPHCLHMADLDGDGRDELITGKRVFAHNGRDPGGKEPPCLYYWTWNPDTKQFARVTIDEGRVGTGLQIRTADLNGDGRLDIAVAGKSGTYVLLNKGPWIE